MICVTLFTNAKYCYLDISHPRKCFTLTKRTLFFRIVSALYTSRAGAYFGSLIWSFLKCKTKTVIYNTNGQIELRVSLNSAFTRQVSTRAENRIYFTYGNLYLFDLRGCVYPPFDLTHRPAGGLLSGPPKRRIAID